MKLLQSLKIIIVFLALVTPGLIFVITGPVTGFEQKEQTVFPPYGLVLLPAPEYREQFADAIFERSAAKRWSVQFMNALHLYGFGFIDTGKAISGLDQWLFYKPQFEAWNCDRHAMLNKKLDRFSLLLDLVTASEIPLVFAHAPNKASIERDRLGGRTTRYLECYFRFEQQFTDAVSGMSPSHFVNHSGVLSHAPGEKPTYLKFDTHWTREHGVHAMNQLFKSRPGVLGIPLYESNTKNAPAITGTLSKILLLEHEELIPVPVPVNPDPEAIRSARLASNVLFIHDSFYGRILPYLIRRSPNARFLLSGSDIGVQARESLNMADIVVVEMVQRHFLESIWSRSRLGWGGTFAEWMLEEMAASTQRCNWEDARDLFPALPDARVSMKNVETTGKNLRMTGSIKSRVFFQVPNDLAAGRVCLSVQLEVAGSGKTNLYFSAPGGTEQQAGYSDALMVSKNLKSGENTLALVLPEAFRGKWVRLDPIDHEGEFTIHALNIAPYN